MNSSDLIRDKFLTSALEVTQCARNQCLKLLEITQNMSHSFPEETISSSVYDIVGQQKLLNSYLAHLRGFNRAAVHRVRQTKQDTAEARAEIDTLHLQLQNLYYEQRHLRGEISACESYKSVTNGTSIVLYQSLSTWFADVQSHKYRSLPLLPLEKIFAVRPELEDLDESALMEARINHEFAEREALEQQRQGLLRTKQSLIAENKKRKEDLASLDQDLEKFIDVRKMLGYLLNIANKGIQAAKPIQKIFEKGH